jgi:hypothetical protein
LEFKKTSCRKNKPSQQHIVEAGKIKRRKLVDMQTGLCGNWSKKADQCRRDMECDLNKPGETNVGEEQTVNHNSLISFSMPNSINGDPTAAVEAFDLAFPANAIVVTAPQVEDVAVQSAGKVASS